MNFTRRTVLQNQVWLACWHPSSTARALTLQKSQNTSPGHDYREEPSLRPHHRAPEPRGWTSLMPAALCKVAAGQSTPHPQALVLPGKAQLATTQMLGKGQSNRESPAQGAALPAGPRKGVWAPAAVLGPCPCLAGLTLPLPQDKRLGADKPVSILNERSLCLGEITEAIKAPGLLVCCSPPQLRNNRVGSRKVRAPSPAWLQLLHPLGMSRRPLLCQLPRQRSPLCPVTAGVPVPAPRVSAHGLIAGSSLSTHSFRP